MRIDMCLCILTAMAARLGGAGVHIREHISYNDVHELWQHYFVTCMADGDREMSCGISQDIIVVCEPTGDHAEVAVVRGVRHGYDRPIPMGREIPVAYVYSLCACLYACLYACP